MKVAAIMFCQNGRHIITIQTLSQLPSELQSQNKTYTYIFAYDISIHIIDIENMHLFLNKQNNFRNGLPSQNHMKMKYYTPSFVS